MDFKKKYLKYKNKYLNQKKILKGGEFNPENSELHSEEYKNLLKHMYPNIIYDNLTEVTEKESKLTKDEKSKRTYGEMTYEGIESLVTLNDKDTHQNIIGFNDINIFLDIGSGRGKLPLWIASYPNIELSFGVEIVNQRHLYAEKLKKDIYKSNPTDFQKFNDKVYLIEGDIKEKISEIKEKIKKLDNKNILVWISNLCFRENLTNDIFQIILKELDPGTIICCSKEPNSVLVRNGYLEYKVKTQIKMSWSESSKVFIYKILKNIIKI